MNKIEISLNEIKKLIPNRKQMHLIDKVINCVSEDFSLVAVAINTALSH